MLTPENLVLQRKLAFFRHLATLPEGSLAKEVFMKQKHSSLGGLVKELEDHTECLGDPTLYTKPQWKKKVTEYLLKKNEQELIEKASTYKKIDAESWKNERFERKEYFSTLDLEGIRMRMRISGGMVNTIRSNYKQKYRRRNQPISCQSCKSNRNSNESEGNVEDEDDEPRDTQIHVLEECVAFEDIRALHDLTSDAGLVNFFSEVVKRRIQEGLD